MISSLMIQVTDSSPSGVGVSIAWLFPMLLLGGLVVGVIILLMSLRGRSRSGAARRLEVLEKALEHPELDAETRAQLVATMVEHQTRRPLGFLFRSSFWLSACFVVGWLLMIVNGVGALLIELELLQSFKLDALLVMGVAGLALATLPVALREFLYRAHQAPDAR